MSTAGDSGVFGTTSPAHNLYGEKRTASFCLNADNTYYKKTSVKANPTAKETRNQSTPRCSQFA